MSYFLDQGRGGRGDPFILDGRRIELGIEMKRGKFLEFLRAEREQAFGEAAETASW